jgi:hypothetical protein
LDDYSLRGGRSMKDFVKNLANLVKVKTIVTLVIIAVFAYLALTGKIESENVMYVVTTVIAFYFGTQHEKKGSV